MIISLFLALPVNEYWLMIPTVADLSSLVISSLTLLSKLMSFGLAGQRQLVASVLAL
jgi:hypothetical protein